MEFRMLGPFETRTDATLVRVGGSRMRALVAAFVLRANQVLSVRSLVAALADQDFSLSGATVHSYVSRMRRRLAAVGPDGVERIATDDGGYRFRVEPGESDVATFRERLVNGRVAASGGRLSEAADELRAALSLWRGSALSDVPGKLASVEAAALNDDRMAALEECAEIDLTFGRHAQVVPDLRIAFLRDPKRERLAGLLMRALYASGRQAEALEVFHETRSALVDQLAVDPGPELRTLHQRILNHDVHPAMPAETISLRPVKDSHFVGRENETAQLCAAGAEPGVLAINGMAGVGKTALALQVADLLADRYPHGCLVVELAAHKPTQRPKTLDAVLTELLTALGLPADRIPLSLDARVAMWRSEVSNRRIVVVLDDAADTAQVRPLLPGLTNSVALITSRRRLVGLPAARTTSLTAMPTGDAAVLFTRLAGDRSVRETATLTDIVETCAGNPLALSLAAARYRNRPSWTARDLHEMLADGPALGVEGTSVNETLAVSWRMLETSQQTALLLLTVHDDRTFDVPAAAASLGAPASQAIEAVESLVDANLLEEVAFGQYHVNRLVRVFVEQQDTGTWVAAARRRLCDYFLRTTGNVYNVLFGQCDNAQLGPFAPDASPQSFIDEQRAMRWWRTEQRRVVDSATGLSPAGVASVPPWRTWSAQFKTHHAVGRMISQDTETDVSALLLSTLGVLCEWRGRDGHAVELHRRSLKRYADLGDEVATASQLCSIGLAELRMKNVGEAVDCGERALMTYRDLGIPWGAGAALLVLSDAYAGLGRCPEARAYASEAVELFADTGDEWALTNARVRRTRLPELSDIDG